jgi:hypothetical protein
MEVEGCILLVEKMDDRLSNPSNGTVAANDNKALICTAACLLSKTELYTESLF